MRFPFPFRVWILASTLLALTLSATPSASASASTRSPRTSRVDRLRDGGEISVPVFVVEERWDLSAVVVRIYWGRELTPLELALDWTEEDVVLFETPEYAHRMSGSCTRATWGTDFLGAGPVGFDAFEVGDLSLTLGLKADPSNARREFLPSSVRGLFGLGKNATLWTLFRRARLTSSSLRLGNPARDSPGEGKRRRDERVPPGVALRGYPERGVFVAEAGATAGGEPCEFVLSPDFGGLYLGSSAWEYFVRGVDLWKRESLARPMRLGLPGTRAHIVPEDWVETADTGSMFLGVYSGSEIRMLPRGARDFLERNPAVVEEEEDGGDAIASDGLRRRRRNTIVAGLRFWKNMALTWDPLEDRMWLDADEIPSSVSADEAVWAGFWLVSFVLWRLYDASPRPRPTTADGASGTGGWETFLRNFHLSYHAAASVASLVFLVFVAFDGSAWRTDEGLRILGWTVRVAAAVLLAFDLFLLGAVRGIGFLEGLMLNGANGIPNPTRRAVGARADGDRRGDSEGDGDGDGNPMVFALQFSHASLMLWALWASLLRNPRDNLGTWLGSVVMLLYLFELHYLMSAAFARYFLRGADRSTTTGPVEAAPFLLLAAIALPAFLANYVLVLIAAVYHTFVPYWEQVAPLLAQFSLWMGWMAAVFTLLLASATLAWIYHSSGRSRISYFSRGSRRNDAGEEEEEESKTDGADPVGLEGVFALIGKYKEGIVFVASGAVFSLVSIENDIEVFLLTLVVFILWTVLNSVAARAGTRVKTRESRKWFRLLSSMSSVMTLILILLLFRLGTQLVIAHLRFNKLNTVQTVLAAGIFLLIALWPVVTMENRT